MTDVARQIQELNERMLRQRLYVVLTRAQRPMEEMLALIPEHIHYLIDLERRGLLFASGPFLDPTGALIGDGLTIFRAASLEEARALAAADPLHREHIRTFEVKPWQLNEGSYTVTVHYSDQSYQIR